MIEYKVIYSRRKTLSLSIDRPGDIIVRSPYYVPVKEIRSFVEKNSDWIENKLAKLENIRESADAAGHYSEEELKAISKRAAEIIPERVEFYAKTLGVSYGRITIRCQKSRWGSCSSKGNLNFNCLLAEMPPEVLDSVVVHELCHRIEMNHSPSFYNLVYSIYPDYDRWDKWLKENGKIYMQRVF